MLFRQTNAVWVAFFAVLAIRLKLSRRTTPSPRHSDDAASSPTGNVRQGLDGAHTVNTTDRAAPSSVVTTTRDGDGAWPGRAAVTAAVGSVWPHAIALAAFGAFVVINGSIVLGTWIGGGGQWNGICVERGKSGYGFSAW